MCVGGAHADRNESRTGRARARLHVLRTLCSACRTRRTARELRVAPGASRPCAAGIIVATADYEVVRARILREWTGHIPHGGSGEASAGTVSLKIVNAPDAAFPSKERK